MSNKIGVGIVTYKREDFFKKCLQSIPNVDHVVVVNDGSNYKDESYTLNKVNELIINQKNLGVGASKNAILRSLIQAGCDHLFVVEDDIILKSPDIFNKYIQCAQDTGLQHLMYGYHGPANLDPATGQPKPRLYIDYKNTRLALNTHCVGAFCYYSRKVIKEVGYIDEHFKNAWDHLEHSYRIAKAGFIPAYWWWPDLAPQGLIEDQDPTLRSSVIRRDQSFNQVIYEGAQWFNHIHGYQPVNVPDTRPEDVVAKLKNIKQKYG